MSFNNSRIHDSSFEENESLNKSGYTNTSIKNKSITNSNISSLNHNFNSNLIRSTKSPKSHIDVQIVDGESSLNSESDNESNYTNTSVKFGDFSRRGSQISMNDL